MCEFFSLNSLGVPKLPRDQPLELELRLTIDYLGSGKRGDDSSVQRKFALCGGTYFINEMLSKPSHHQITFSFSPFPLSARPPGAASVRPHRTPQVVVETRTYGA